MLHSLLAVTLMITPSVADTEIRYAWVDDCNQKRPCGSWTLSLRDGKELRLKDAVVKPRLGNGTIAEDASAPIAISGDGRLVGYFRKRDNKLVVRDMRTGTVKALPGRAAKLPKGLGMNDLDTAFSDTGRRFFIDYYDEKNALATLVVDLRTGTITTIRGNETIQGFSPDGSRLLTSRTTDDNTTEFVVYDEFGRALVSRVVPQIVLNNAPIALAADGVTIGMVIVGPKSTSPARLRTYNLTTDAVSGPITLGYPPARESASRIMWEPSGGLTLWTYRPDGQGNPVGAIKRQVNAQTGASVKRDSFRMKTGVWSWWLPGD